MATKTYTLAEFERIGKTELPEQVLNTIRILCGLVGYVENTPNTYINQHNTTPNTVSKKPKEKEVRERIYKKPKESKDEWKRPVFKATVFAEVDATQEKINEIRIGLNKIKEENCEEKINMIIEKIEEIRDSIDFGDDCEMADKMQTIFDTIYTICVSNKIFSKIYACVIACVCTKYGSEFHEMFEKKIGDYLASLENIVDVDSNVDYDAFCEFTAKNNMRKNITNLLCDIAKLGTYAKFQMEDIMKLVSHMFSQIDVMVEDATKQKNVEEITESIVIIFSHFGKDLKEKFKHVLDKLACGGKPGLSNRTRFKYMDLK